MTNGKVTPIYGHRKRTKFGNSYRKSTRLKSVNIINSVHCESKHKLRQQANIKNNRATTSCLEVLLSTLKTSHYYVVFVILLFSCGFTHGMTASLHKKTVNTNDLFASSSQSAFLTKSVPIYDSKTRTNIPKGSTLVPDSMFDVSKHILPSFTRTNSDIPYTVQISDTGVDVTSEEVLSNVHEYSDLLASQRFISAYDSRYTSMFIPMSHSITDVTRTTTSFDVESKTIPNNDIPNTINKVSGIHLASSTRAFTTAEIIPTRTLKESEQNNSKETDKTFVISTNEQTNSISKLNNENITSRKKILGFVTPSRLSIEYKNSSSVENSMDAQQSDTLFSLDLLTQIDTTKGKQSEVNHIPKTQEGILHTKSVAHTEKTLLVETSPQIAPSYASKQTKTFIELDTSITQIFSHVENTLSPYSYKSVIVTSSPTLQTQNSDNIDQQTVTTMTDSIGVMNTPKIATREITLPTSSKLESQNEETESDAETYIVLKGSEDSNFYSLTDLVSQLHHTGIEESSLLGMNSDTLQSMISNSKEDSIQVSSISKSFESTKDYSHNMVMNDSLSFGTNTMDLNSASYSYTLLEMRSESGELLISQIGYSQVEKPALLYITTSTLSTFYNTIVLEETEDHNASSLNITPRSVTYSMSPPTSLANASDIIPSSASSDESRTDHKLQTKDENTYVESQTTSPSYRANTVLTATQTHKPFNVSTQQSVSEFSIETPYLVTGESDRVHSSDFEQNNSQIDLKSSLLLTPSVHEDTTSSNDLLIKDSVTLKEIYPSLHITFTDQSDNALQTQYISSSYQHYHDVFESSETHLTFDDSLTVLSRSTFATSKSDNIKQSSTIPFMSTDVISHTALEQEMSKFYSDLNLHSIVDSTYIVSLDGSKTRTSPTAVLPYLISNDIRTSKVYDSIDRSSKLRFSTHTGQMSDQQASSSNKMSDSKHFLNEQISLTHTKSYHGDPATTRIASAPTEYSSTRKSLFQEPISPSRDVSIDFAGNSNIHNQYSMASSSSSLLNSSLGSAIIQESSTKQKSSLFDISTSPTPDLRYSTSDISSEPSMGDTYVNLGTSPFIDHQIESSFSDSNSFGVHSSNRVSKSTSIVLSLGGIDGTYNTTADGSTSNLNKPTYTISPFKTIYPGFTSQFSYSTHTIGTISRRNHGYTDSDKLSSFIHQFTVTTQTKSSLITGTALFDTDLSFDILSSIRPSFSGVSTTIDSRISSLELDFQTALQTQETLSHSEMSSTMPSNYTIDSSLQFHNSFVSDKYETIQNSKFTFLSSNMEFPVSTEIQGSIVSAIELPSIDQFKTTIIESETDKIYETITTMLSSTAKYPTDSVKPSDKLVQEYTSVLSDKPMNSLTSQESSDKFKFDTRIHVSASLTTYSYNTPLASSNYITIATVEMVKSHSSDSSTYNTLYTSMVTQDKSMTGSTESDITTSAGTETTSTSQMGFSNIHVQSSYYTSEKAEHSITSISSNVYSKPGSDSRRSELSLLPTSVVFKSDYSMSTEIFSKEITDLVLSSIDSQRNSSTFETDSSSHGMSLISLTKLPVSPNTATVNTELVSFQLASQEVVTSIERTELFGSKSTFTFHNSEDPQAQYSPNSNIESSFSAILLIPSSFEKLSLVHSTTHVGMPSVSVINTIFVSGSNNPTDSISRMPMSRSSLHSSFTETSVASSSSIHRGEAFTVLHTASSNDPSELQTSTIATSQSIANVTNDQALKNTIASDLIISLTPNETSVLTANTSLPLIPTESIFKSESLSVKSLTNTEITSVSELITSSTARELGTSSMHFATRSTSILFSDQINTEQSLKDIETGSTSITMGSASIDHSSEIRTQKHSNSKSGTGSVVLISELSTESNTGYEIESTLYPDTISSPDISVMFYSYPYLFPSIRRNSLYQSGSTSIPAHTSRSNNVEPTPESALVFLSENVDSFSNTNISTIASTEEAASAIFQPWLRSSYGSSLISATKASTYIPYESYDNPLKSSYKVSSRTSSKMQSNLVLADISNDGGYSRSESGGVTLQRDFASTNGLGSGVIFSEASIDVTESNLMFSVQTYTTFKQDFSEMKSQNYFSHIESTAILQKDTVSRFVQPSSPDTTILFTNRPASIASVFQVSMERANSSEFLINGLTTTMSIFHSTSMADVFTTLSTDNPAFLSMSDPTSHVTRASSFLRHKVPNSKSIYDSKNSVREEISAITLITSYGTILQGYLNSAVTHTGDYITKSSKMSDKMQTISMYSPSYSTGTISTPNDSPISYSSYYLKTFSSRENILSISEGSISAEHPITSSNVYTISDPGSYPTSGFSYDTMLFGVSDSITSPIYDLSALSTSSRSIMFSSTPPQSTTAYTDSVTVTYSTLATKNPTFLQDNNQLSSTARVSSYVPGSINFIFDSSIFDTSESILSSSSELSTISTIRDSTMSSSSQPFDTGYNIGKIVSSVQSASDSTYETKWASSAYSFNGLPALSTVRNGMIKASNQQFISGYSLDNTEISVMSAGDTSFDAKLADTVTITPFLSHLKPRYESDNIAYSMTSHNDNSLNRLFIDMSDSTSTISSKYIMSTLSPIRDSTKFSSGKHFGSGYDLDSKMKFVTSTEDLSYHITLTDMIAPTGFSTFDNELSTSILSGMPSSIYRPMYNVTAPTSISGYHTHVTDIITPTPSGMFSDGITTFTTFGVSSSIYASKYDETSSTLDSNYNTKLTDIITLTLSGTFGDGVNTFTTSDVSASIYTPIYNVTSSTRDSSYHTILRYIITPTPSITFDDVMTTFTTSDVSSSLYTPIYNATLSTRDPSYHTILGDMITPTPSITFDVGISTFKTSNVHSFKYPPTYNVTSSTRVSSYGTKLTYIITQTASSGFDNGVTAFTMFTTSDVSSAMYPSIYDKQISTTISSYDAKLKDIITPSPTGTFDDGMSTFTTPDVSASMHPSIYAQTSSARHSSYHTKLTYIATPNPSSTLDGGMSTFILSDVPSTIYSQIYNVTASTRDTSYHTKLTDKITPTTSSMFNDGITPFATSEVSSSIKPPLHNVTASTHGSSYNTKLMDIITSTTSSTFDGGVSTFTTSVVPPSVYPPIYDMQISTSISSYNTTLADIVTATPSSAFDDQISTLTTSDMSSSINRPIHNVATSTRDLSYHSIMTDIVTFDDGKTMFTTSSVHSSIKPSVYTTVASKSESIYHIKMTDKVTPTPSSTLDHGMTTFTASDVHSSIYPPIYDITASIRDSSYNSMVTDIVTPTVSSTFGDGMSTFTAYGVSSSMYTPIYDQSASTLDSSYHSIVTYIVTPNLSSSFDGGVSTFTTFNVSTSIYMPVYDLATYASSSGYHTKFTDIITPTPSSTFEEGISTSTQFDLSSSVYPLIYNRTTLLTLTLQMKPSIDVNDPNVVEELEMGLLLCYEEGAIKGLQTDSLRKRRQVDNDGENDAKVTSMTRRNDEPSYVDAEFYVTEDGVPLQSDDVEDTLNQLSLVELSAYLGYPVISRPRAVTKVTTDDVDDDDTSVPLLVIVPIVGLLVALIVIVMVIYCCRKRYHGNQRKTRQSFVPSLTLKKPTLEEMDLMIDMERGEVVSRKSNTSTLATKPSTNTNTLSTALQRLQETGAEKVTEMPLRLNTYQYFQRSFSQICSPHDRLERLKSLGLNVTEIHTKTLYQIAEAPSNSENVAERPMDQSQLGVTERPNVQSKLGVDRPSVQSHLGGDLQNSSIDKKEDTSPFSSINNEEQLFEFSSSESNPNANEDQNLIQLDREEKLWNKVTFMANDGYLSDSSPRSKKAARVKRVDENTRRKDGYNFSNVGLDTSTSRKKNTRTRKKYTRHKPDNVRQRYPENSKLANVLDVHSYGNKILENPDSTVIQNQKYHKGDNSYIDTDTDSVYLPSVTDHSYNTDRDSYLYSDLDQQSELDDWNNSFNDNRHASDLQYCRSKQRLMDHDAPLDAVNPVMYRYFEPTERFYNADRENNYRDGSEYAGFEFDSVNFSTNYRPERANKSPYHQLSPVHPSSSYQQEFITGQPYKNFSQRNPQMEMAEPIVQYPEPSDPSALEHVTKMGRVGSKGVATYKPRFRPIPFQEHRATPMSTLESEQVQKREQETINRTPQLIQPYEPFACLSYVPSTSVLHTPGVLKDAEWS